MAVQSRKTQVPAKAPPPQQQQPDLYEEVPDFMRDDAGMGAEHIAREDMVTPRLKLIQALSPELTAYDDLRPGHFFHTQQEFSFGPNFVAVPIFTDKAFILWRPRRSGGGILARAGADERWSVPRGSFTVQLDNGKTVIWRMAPTVAESGLGEFGSSDPDDPSSPPAATEMYNYLLAFPDNPELMPAVLSFQRSSRNVGRRLNTAVKTAAYNGPEGVGKPIFGRRYKFKSMVARNSRGQEYYNIDEAVKDGLVTDPALYNLYKQMHLAYKPIGFSDKVVETLQDEVGIVANGDGKAPF